MKTRVCAKAGCGRTAEQGKRFCNNHSELENQKRTIYTRRGKSSEWIHLYKTYEWQKIRKAVLTQYPLCVDCGQPATVVDHIIHHQGNLKLFYDMSNLQPLCARCHSRKTLKENGNFHKKIESTWVGGIV